MARKSLYSEDVYEDCLRRIGRLTPEATPEWGTMTSAQMLAHCAEVQLVANGSKPLEGTPFMVRLIGPLIRRMVVDAKPYSRSTRTHPQYLQAEERNFGHELERLLNALQAFRQAENEPPARHPLFGELNHAERGWSSYKHLDHHLRQFGV